MPITNHCIYDSPQSYILTHMKSEGITLGFTRRAILFLLSNQDYCTLDRLHLAQQNALNDKRTIIDTPDITQPALENK